MALENTIDSSTPLSGGTDSLGRMLDTGSESEYTIKDIVDPLKEIITGVSLSSQNSVIIKDSIVNIDGILSSVSSIATDISNISNELLKGISSTISLNVSGSSFDINGLDSSSADTSMNVVETTTKILTDISNLSSLAKSAEESSKTMVTASTNINTFLSNIAGGESIANKALSVTDKLTGMLTSISNFNPMKVIGGFALSVALLGLSVYGFTQLIGIEDTISFGLSMAVIGASVYLFSKIDTKPMLTTAASIAIFGLTVLAFNELIDIEDTLGVATTIAFLGGVFWLLGKQGKQINTGAQEVLFLSASVLVLAGATMVFENVSWEALAKTGVSLLGVTGAFFLLGKMSGNVIMGSAALLIGSAAMVVFGAAALIFENVSWEGLAKMGAGLVGLGIALTGIGIASPFILAGSIALLAGSAGLLAMAGALVLVNQFNINQDTVDTMNNAVLSVSDMYTDISYKSPMILAGSLAGISMGVSTIAIATSLMMVSNLDISEEQIQAYNNSVLSLTDVYTSIGAGTMLKMALSLPSMLSMAVGTLAVGGALKLITGLNLSEQEVTDGVTKPLNAFITAISTVLNDNKDTFDEVEDGIDAFQGIGNLVGGIAEGVGKMAKLEFVESAVVDGKLVTKSVRKLNESDFAQVGVNISKIINAIKTPLAEIGADAGLFSDSDVKNGIEELQGIGDVFNPIIGIAQMFTGEQALTTANIDAMNAGLKAMVMGIKNTFTQSGLDELEDVDTDTLEDAVEIITDIAEAFAEDGLDKAASSLEKIQVSMREIKNDINAMDIEKLTKMNDFFINLNLAGENNDNIASLLDKVIEMLGSVNGMEESTEKGGTTTIITKESTTNTQALQDNQDEFNNVLRVSMDSVVEVLEDIYERLGSTLKTKQIETI